MSWMRLSMVMWGNEVRSEEATEVEPGKLREVTFLRRYTGSVDDRMAPEELGRRIDHGLVEYIRMQLLPLRHEHLGIAGFKWKMRQIEEGMRENMALKAFAAT